MNKRIEARVVEWYLTRACGTRYYKQTEIDRTVLETLRIVKLNSGEAPAEVLSVLREVIPNEILEGPTSVGCSKERRETRRVNPNNNPAQERPATRSNRVGDIVQSSGESRRAGINSQRRETN